VVTVSPVSRALSAVVTTGLSMPSQCADTLSEIRSPVVQRMTHTVNEARTYCLCIGYAPLFVLRLYGMQHDYDTLDL
jgi:hypothetical protein